MAQSALWRNGFFNHVTLVAEIEDDGQRPIIVGGARYCDVKYVSKKRLSP
jgi:hypothetical protein